MNKCDKKKKEISGEKEEGIDNNTKKVRDAVENEGAYK